MNSTRGPALKWQKRFHPYQRAPPYTDYSSIFTTGTILPDQMTFFTSPGTSDQFINATDMNHMVPSTVYNNACFDPWNSYGQWDQISAGSYTSTPVGLHFTNLLLDGNGCEPYSVDGLPPLAINQQPVGLQLPMFFDYNDYTESFSPTSVTENATSALKPLPVEDIVGTSDFLDELISHDDLEEAAQPDFIKTPLQRYQKQALTFMLQREEGWMFSDKKPGIWKIESTEKGQFYVNRVSDTPQSEEPAQCYGGILADLMGLGKTLTMIALVAAGLRRRLNEMDPNGEGPKSVPSTLIVVPSALMGTWKKQLSQHVEDNLGVYVYHGQGRLLSTADLKSYGIVLTTYETIGAEWRRPRDSPIDTVFSTRWRRIIIDEAHTIRNPKSKVSQAICALESRSYWAVTGTPIQNRLSDLAMLFKFIRAHPYTDQGCFDTDISRPWKAGKHEEAIQRLKLLLRCVMLRRSKGTIKLPPRKDIQRCVNFNMEERILYDRIRGRIIEDVKKDKKRVNSKAFQRILSLRRVCSLGSHHESGHTMEQHSSEDENGEDFVQNISETELDSSLLGVLPQTNKGLPSKVVALIADIEAHEPSEKCIVFSEWTGTLDLIQSGLRQSNIRSLRLDGGVAQNDRMRIIEEFGEGSSIRVLLLTLGCGANGLTLTAANRAYIMEPQWNPSVEEQALARIYRMGQTREVTTVRFFVTNSYEENVIKKQESKKDLAGLLFSTYDNEKAIENPGGLKELLSLI